MKKNSIIIGLIIILALSAFPLETRADAIDTIGGAIGGDDDFVPIKNPAWEEKEIGDGGGGDIIGALGKAIPGLEDVVNIACGGWDSCLVAAAKVAIDQITNSTLDWINSGFEGNPTYVTEPGKFFGNIADGVAGEFLQGSDLGFLCSPFQNSIRISLAQNYNSSHGYGESRFQCTVSEAWGNIEDWYGGNFKEGGWKTWLAVSQNPSNNPYGAYLEAKVELDSRIAEDIGINEKMLEWGSGFLGAAECIKSDPETGECIERGPISTPGTLVEGQLEKLLGSNVSQLELADEFDELSVAAMTAIADKIAGLFSNRGLKESGGAKGEAPAASLVSCIPMKKSVQVGEQTAWTVLSFLGSNQSFVWTGDEMTNINSRDAVISYAIPGEKSAQVRVTAIGNDGEERTVSVNCSDTILVSAAPAETEQPQQ